MFRKEQHCRLSTVTLFPEKHPNSSPLTTFPSCKALSMEYFKAFKTSYESIGGKSYFGKSNIADYCLWNGLHCNPFSEKKSNSPVLPQQSK